MSRPDIKSPELIKTNFKAPEFYLEILEVLRVVLGVEEDGLWLYGGALRDLIYNEHVQADGDAPLHVSDYDITILTPRIEGYDEAMRDVSQAHNEKHATYTWRQQEIYTAFHDGLLDKLRAYDCFIDFEINQSDYSLRHEPVIKLKYKGVSLDITLKRQNPRSLSEELQSWCYDRIESHYDATVNAVSMTVDGEIWAAPDFMQHLQDGIYRYVQSGHLSHCYERLLKMREKFPDMKGHIDPRKYVPLAVRDLFIRVGDVDYVAYLQPEWRGFFEENKNVILDNHAVSEEDECCGIVHDDSQCLYSRYKLERPSWEVFFGKDEDENSPPSPM